MTGWRDTVSIDAPADITAQMGAVLDAIDPWYALARLVKPTVVRWRYDTATYNAKSWDDEVWINARPFAAGGWEQALAHEVAHVVDKQLMTNADRAAVMALVSGCKARNMDGVCVDPLVPVWGLDGSVPYSQRCGELFAETVSRHVWYAQIKGLSGADLPAYGAYTYEPATALPVMLAALKPAQTKPQAPAPTPQEDPTMLVKKWIYGEGADLLAAMSAARATGAAVVTGRGEAAALIKAGATITVIGGPACTALALTWATTGRKTQGAVTACNGATYADSLALALAS